MEKYLFYAMQGEKMCFVHLLLNALDLFASGKEVKIVFEGKSVTLPSVLDKEGGNPLYKKAVDSKIIAGVCLACAKTLGVEQEIKRLNLDFISDLSGHAGLKPYIENGYKVLIF